MRTRRSKMRGALASEDGYGIWWGRGGGNTEGQRLGVTVNWLCLIVKGGVEKGRL